MANIKYISQILPKKSEKLFVAVSMGIDSVAAFFYLWSKGYNVVPIHFNHKLRPQNDAMATNFKQLFLDFNINSHIESGENLKTESDCRNARIAFFNKVAKGHCVVTAHHLDDYIESYLMNCFRGQPAFKPISLQTKFDNCQVLHPFLKTKKQDFVQFVRCWKGGKLRQYIVEDETNSIVKGSRRNWIRNEIVPSMNKQSIGLDKYCLRLIENDILELDEKPEWIEPPSHKMLPKQTVWLNPANTKRAYEEFRREYPNLYEYPDGNFRWRRP
jgi:tRNA(Ile)-lysidine synthase